MTASVQSFRALVDQYPVLFLDAFGVLRTSTGLLPGVPEVLQHLGGTQKPFWILTNDASSTPEEMAQAYQDPKTNALLVPPDRLLSSGWLVVDYIKRMQRQLRKPIHVAYLGPAASARYLHAAYLQSSEWGGSVLPVTEVKDQDAIDALVFFDDRGFHWKESLNTILDLLVRRPEMLVLLPNNDLIFPLREGHFGIGAGGLFAMFESILTQLGKQGRFIRLGKPAPPLFEAGLAQARQQFPHLKPREVLMVGDSLSTDIQGAHALGLHTTLVLSGNTSRATYEAEAGRLGITPTYVIESITM